MAGTASPDQSRRTRARTSKPDPTRRAPADYDPPPRRPAEARENAFNALAWLLEGATGLVEELRHNDLGLNEEFWVHFYAARRESLLAARALVESLLEQVEQESRKAEERAERQSRRGGVSIDF